MELFYSNDIRGDLVYFDQDEACHLIKVLRHRRGDEIAVMDGKGCLLHCRLEEDSPKAASALILSREEGFGAHPYTLTLAVCPTKNNERFEWMGEKATEFGMDVLCPVIGEHSERKIYKTERMKRIVLSAAKQSLKAAIPLVEECVSVKDFICSRPDDELKLIAYCFEGRKISIKEALQNSSCSKVSVLIGPEGDFSAEEVQLALDKGFVPVHLGTSRLRTETAALCAVMAVYNKYM